MHRSEDSGFGACLRESEIGLFCLPATLMYGKSDTLMELQSHLNLKLASEKKLEQDLFRSQEQIAKICQERNDLQIQVNSLKFEFENRWKTEFQTKIEEKEREVFDLRIKTEALIMNLKTDYDSQLQRFAEDLDRERREKEANRMNYESDLQNVKNQQKRNKEALLEHTDKVRKEIEDKNARLAYMQRQLDEKVTQEKELFEENQRLVRQTFDMQKMVEDQQGADVQLWLEEQRMVERENIEREYQDRELCIICMSEKKNTVFVPCGHLMYCNICLNNMNLPIGKKIPKNHQQSKCSCCDARVKIIHRAYPY